ncbi:MAG TPA: CPBP family glutamic-type intramembrane protease [Caldisericia bacterium]|nr:CPBP family glutamic-type intramembrane protease [Caldisericia bacterium]
MERLKEILILVLYMGAILLFPWLSFLLVRFIATFAEIDPAGILGTFMSAIPNIVMFVIAYFFLKLDDWDFNSIGISLNRILPGFVFALLSLAGLYIILPFSTSIFYEPRTLYVSMPVINASYISNLIISWLIVGICEEFAARGYMLNKFYSVIPDKVNNIVKKIISALFVALFFTIVGYIRLRTAGNINISSNTLYTIFFYGLFVTYLYMRTGNLFVAAFMQAALDFPFFGITVGREGLTIMSFGFLFSISLVFLFIILLAETYNYWGKWLTFGGYKLNEEEVVVEEGIPFN